MVPSNSVRKVFRLNSCVRFTNRDRRLIGVIFGNWIGFRELLLLLLRRNFNSGNLAFCRFVFELSKFQNGPLFALRFLLHIGCGGS